MPINARSRRWSSPSWPTTTCAAAGIRDRVELVYATPLPGAFTKPIASAPTRRHARRPRDHVEADFLVERVDKRTTLVSYDEREIPFDLLVTVPLNMGADYVARSGLGDELNLCRWTRTPCCPRPRQHLRDRRRQRHPHLEGRVGGPLRA